MRKNSLGVIESVNLYDPSNNMEYRITLRENKEPDNTKTYRTQLIDENQKCYVIIDRNTRIRGMKDFYYYLGKYETLINLGQLK